MFKMSSDSRTFLQKHCPDLLKIENLRDFLIELDDFIIMNGLDENQDMTPFGHQIQAVYDEIYCCN